MKTLNFSKLLPIQNHHINNSEMNSINARQLHSTLAIKKQFSNWIENQIQRAELTLDTDYIILKQTIKHSSGAKHITDYILTLDSAKHIAMMSQSKKAKEVRNYFIEVENRYLASLKAQIATTPKTTISLSSSLTDELFQQNSRLLAMGVFTVKLTSNEIRVLSAIIKLQKQSSKNYLVMTNRAIASHLKMNEKSVVTAIVKLEDAQAIVKTFKRNEEGRVERRLTVSNRLLKTLDIETKSVATPPPLPVIKQKTETTSSMEELKALVKQTVKEELAELRAKGNMALPLNSTEKRIKALTHAIGLGKEMMVREPHLKKEYELQIHNGEVQLERLLENA